MFWPGACACHSGWYKPPRTALEQAVRRALAAGRTADLHRGDPRYTLAGTRDMVIEVTEQYYRLMNNPYESATAAEQHIARRPAGT